MSRTIAADRAEILNRPSFRFYENLITNKVGAAILQAQQTAQLVTYLQSRMTDVHYEKNVFGAPLTLPTSSGSWGSTGSIYQFSSSSTPVLPADMVRIKKLWLNRTTSTLITVSKATYDTDTVIGSGIPDDTTTTLAAGDVYHEFTGELTSAQLTIFAGSTAADATTKANFIYVRAMSAVAADTDILDIPDEILYTTWDQTRNQYLDYYIGFHQ